jgi:crotonobetainyl-CoA:carnitine CoA-transferase CaiB-like acyl-CoA transferase
VVRKSEEEAGVGLQLRVIERGSSVAGAYCGRLLGMLGADVIKLEAAEGDPMRRAGSLLDSPDDGKLSTMFEYLNAFKRSVVNGPADNTAIDALIEGADVLIDHIDGDPDAALKEHARIAASNPRLVHVAISSFGLTGPWRGFRGNEFIDFASGGYTFITGDQDREPVQAGAPVAGYTVGLNAAIAALAAVRGRALTGRGQLVDVAAMESMAAIHQWSFVLFTHQGVIKRRAGNRHAESYFPMGPMPCEDGWVCLGVSTPAQWEGFCLAIDLPELLADERFSASGLRFDHAEELRELIEPAMMSMPAAELVERCAEHHVPASPVLDAAEVLDEEQLESREYWVASKRLGGGAKMPERPFHMSWMEAPFRPAPVLGENTDEVLENPRGRI